MTLLDPARRVLRVGELTLLIRGAINTIPALEDCHVEGEVANLRLPGSGHVYLTLRDAGSSLRCVCFRAEAQRIGFQPVDGMRVIAHGRVDVYQQDGTYQLYVDRLEPSGIGALALATEQVRRRLAVQGLFDERHKRPLPLLPRRVAVVTSPTGAAVRDVLNVLRRRAPGVGVVVVPAPVQGDGAEQALIEALRRAGELAQCDVVLLVRGGGSLEDLRAFQDEQLARAIRRCPVPVVTGIGHEIDTSVADLAADRRAATPSVAAQLAVPDVRELAAQLRGSRGRLDRAVQVGMERRRRRADDGAARLRRASPARRLPELRQRIERSGELLRHALLREVALQRRRLDTAGACLQVVSPGQTVLRERVRLAAAEGTLRITVQAHAATRRREFDALSARLAVRSPAAGAGTRRAGLDAQRERLSRAVRTTLERSGDRLHGAQSTLQALSPLRILERGYSVTTDARTGALARTAATLAPGTVLRTRLAQGVVVSEVRDAG